MNGPCALGIALSFSHPSVAAEMFNGKFFVSRGRCSCLGKPSLSSFLQDVGARHSLGTYASQSNPVRPLGVRSSDGDEDGPQRGARRGLGVHCNAVLRPYARNSGSLLAGHRRHRGGNAGATVNCRRSCRPRRRNRYREPADCSRRSFSSTDHRLQREAQKHGGAPASCPHPAACRSFLDLVHGISAKRALVARAAR